MPSNLAQDWQLQMLDIYRRQSEGARANSYMRDFQMKRLKFLFRRGLLSGREQYPALAPAK
jgi:hypothetical protein